MNKHTADAAEVLEVLPEIDISEPIAITGSVNNRNEKIKLLTQLQKLEASIKTLRGDGRDDLAGEFEKELSVGMPTGYRDLAEVASRLEQEIAEARKIAIGAGLTGSKLSAFLDRAKLRSLDVITWGE